jgi:hypothetical protein
MSEPLSLSGSAPTASLAYSEAGLSHGPDRDLASRLQGDRSDVAVRPVSFENKIDEQGERLA